ncbi:Retrovirus-related Pol polyprotein from transposon RE1 [Bienertia sinuspersici]
MADHTSNGSNLSFPSVQDPTSVYYIHPSENTSQVLVSERFNGECFGDWKRSMLIALSAKNKLAFIDGSLPKPPPGDVNYKAWERCNDLVISCILRSLDHSIARSVLYLNSAAEIWQDLEERFAQSSGPQLYTLQQNLHDLNQGSDEPIAEFFTRIISLWDEIIGVDPVPICTCNRCTCNLTKQFLQQQQEQRLIQFLMKLDPKFHQARSTILMMQPLPPITIAYKLLMQDEKQRQVALTIEDQFLQMLAKLNIQHHISMSDLSHHMEEVPSKKAIAVAQSSDDVEGGDTEITHICMDQKLLHLIEKTDQETQNSEGLGTAQVAVFDKKPNTITVADGKSEV